MNQEAAARIVAARRAAPDRRGRRRAAGLGAGRADRDLVGAGDEAAPHPPAPSPASGRGAGQLPSPLQGRGARGGGWTRPSEELAAIFFTSGTTGNPKGCMISHANLLSQIEAAGDMIPLDASCRLASILPLSHLFELTCGLLYPIARGAAVHYVPSRRGPDILRVLKEQQITHMLAVPQLLTIMGQALDGQFKEKLPKPAYDAHDGAGRPAAVRGPARAVLRRPQEARRPAPAVRGRRRGAPAGDPAPLGEDGHAGRPGLRRQRVLADHRRQPPGRLDADRQRRQAAPRRRGEAHPGGRAAGARPERHARLLEGPRAHRRGAPGRLVLHRRPGPHSTSRATSSSPGGRRT